MVQEGAETSKGLRKFEWPDKETFTLERDALVESKLEVTKREISSAAPELSDEHLSLISKMYLRAFYVATYMADHAPLSIPKGFITASCIADIGNTKIGGICIPQVSIDGNVLDDISDASEEDVEKLVLEKITAGISLKMMIFKMNSIDEDYNELKEHYNEKAENSPEEIDERLTKRRNKKIEELAIECERNMVEEIAHAFYYIAAFKSVNKLKRVLIEKKNYPMFDLQNNDFQPLTDDPRSLPYLDDSMESSARLWVNSFLEKLYPQSRVAEDEKRVLLRIKNINARKNFRS